MKLRCYNKGVTCPSYKHSGVFYPDNKTLTRLIPDLKRCANCMAYSPPKMNDFRDDLQQIAAITLCEKGPSYNPTHSSHATFGTFIRPRICVSLMNAKNKEIAHLKHFTSVLSEDPEVDDVISQIPNPVSESFVDEFIWKDSVENFEKSLPRLLQFLTPREQQVFKLIRKDNRNTDIAEMLNLSKARITVLMQQMEQKLKQACEDLMLL